MSKIKVYDLLNAEHEMESVDARECVSEMGWTLEPQQAADPESADVDGQGLDPIKRGRKPKGE